MQRLLYVLCVGLAAPVAAEDGPSFDCAKAESTAEQTVCEDAGLAALDRLIDARYSAAVTAARSLDTGADAAVNTLRASQRGWIKGRDECWTSDDVRGCIERSYLLREGDLVAFWMLEEPVGTDVWQCDGNPANEVVTMYFDTVLPSVRFERGDKIDAGSLVPTASGSKYEGSFGRSIWVKGDEATYRAQDPVGHTVDCVKAN